MGSSPHARGTLDILHRYHHYLGIIPACAGNTKPIESLAGRSGDHPRMRGEHPLLIDPMTCDEGSSPHARGTLLLTLEERRFNGIIPACAGNTTVPAFSAISYRDHPRMRGEHVITVQYNVSAEGSSPHARGTRVCAQLAVATWGIIPACAGNTPESSTAASPTTDHPRMRGEHSRKEPRSWCNLGSSPHARGTRVKTH